MAEIPMEAGMKGWSFGYDPYEHAWVLRDRDLNILLTLNHEPSLTESFEICREMLEAV